VSAPPAIEQELTEVRAATARLLATVDGLGDAHVGKASSLPGWTVGHVLTHVARNADGNRRIAGGAARGEVLEQYPHGVEGRAADIEAGAGRPAADLAVDVRTSAAALDATWMALPIGAWDQTVRPMSGEQPVRQTVVSRRREVEVHHIDLGLGYRPGDWPAAFVARELERAGSGLPGRLPPGTAVRLAGRDLEWAIEVGDGPASVSVSGPGAWVLAWLLGRRVPASALWAPAGLPDLGPWQ